jgi:lipoprotein-anchoring transpeptidase ErfK/SrfK
MKAIKVHQLRMMSASAWMALAGMAFLAVASITVGAQPRPPVDIHRIPEPTHPDVDPGIDRTDATHAVPAEYRRQLVLYRTSEPPGTIVVHTADRFLYLIQENNRALRYGIGVGRDGFTWAGVKAITRKREWPDWRPPPEMIERQPYLPRFMAGGPGNPLGARAMDLGATEYRIHGTNAPETIGHAVSSGCIRLVNEDVIDLYDRIPLGARVVVLHQ